MKDCLNTGTSIREAKGETSSGLASSQNPFALWLLLSTPNGQKIFLQAIRVLLASAEKAGSTAD
jgi:hypothetical protein